MQWKKSVFARLKKGTKCVRWKFSIFPSWMSRTNSGIQRISYYVNPRADRLIKFELLSQQQVWLTQTLLTHQSMILLFCFVLKSHLHLTIFIPECPYFSEVKTLHGSLTCITSKVN